MSLAQTQRAFSAWLRTGATDDAIPFGSSAQPGMAIYQNNFRAQLADCLEDSFPQTRQWIGGEAFHDAVVHHVERVPPSSWTLDAYPRDFPATLALLYTDDPEVGELADLELGLAEAFVGPDAEQIAAVRIAQVDWDRAILRFTPTLDLRPLKTNAPDIWNALASKETPPAAMPSPKGAALMIWRQGETSRFRVIDGAEHQSILQTRNGLSFAALCAQLVDQMGETDGVAVCGAWLGTWLAEGLLTDIVQCPNSSTGAARE
ncbi:putative DNA-binding domain-containing protein [Sphingopyxis sp. C-1]|uniref:HvfC/BufC family peptide modification chaperone n=1 Tax=Sphingopyxis sp. C-1 TaxID=262667 RepID=UPI0006C093A0|nr:putative DNA-binding domain-containing protein [Sphingopyxis sp. C-1]GAO77500.1 conserved domain protein [Sphingopyxis sp. C-1]